MIWIDLVGYLAALTVLATFLHGYDRAAAWACDCKQCPVHLLWHRRTPLSYILLHAVLLPVNIVKFVKLRLQVRRANGRQTRAGSAA
jgi:hypothetical protein